MAGTVAESAPRELPAGKESWRLNSSHCPDGSPRPVACAVAGLGIVRATAGELPALRQKPGQVGTERLPASFLKHADDQTVDGERRQALCPDPKFHAVSPIVPSR